MKEKQPIIDAITVINDNTMDKLNGGRSPQPIWKDFLKIKTRAKAQ